LDWAWGKEAQFRSDVVPQVGLDDNLQASCPATNYEITLDFVSSNFGISSIDLGTGCESRSCLKRELGILKGAGSFHLKVPICDLWENGKIYDIDSCRDYICGLKH
jgi:hypothetical protein